MTNVEVQQPPRKKSGLLKKILLGLVVIVAGLAIVIAMQPADFVIQRSASMSAPPSAVYAQLNDFHNWKNWSPWEERDPNMQRTFEGAPAGTGAVYAWKGNNEVGEGRMTITESRPNELVRINLEFIKPFADTSTTQFTINPQGGDQSSPKISTVTWKMSGRHNFISKAVCLFMNMDKLVGADFEKGLAKMKSTVEAAPKN